MIKTLRTKLLIGITPLLAIIVGLGLWAIVMFSRLGNNIDIILKENYRSVRAAEGMKESLERMDSSLLFAILGKEDRARAQLAEHQPLFDHHFKVEQGNITILPDEQLMVDRLTGLRSEYFTLIERFFKLAPERKEERTELYLTRLQPTFTEIKHEADSILELNQKNMEQEDARARSAASTSIRLMFLALIVSAAVATMIAVMLSRSILDPIRDVTRGARAMARGELDQVVPVVTHDELGELAAAFNTMARTIREFREAGTARLLRAQQTAQATIDSFPDPVVVVDPTAAVERANPAARRLLGVFPNEGAIPWSPPAMLKPAIDSVLGGGPDSLPTGLEHALCFRDQGQERFYLPRVLAIRDDEVLLGAAVVLTDVTKFRLVDQLKSDMVSTVSHELKTPLTGVQMAVHLLLEEAIGPLNTKQTELLLAARQESDRLLAMINDLLDLTRIEQGRIKLDLRPASPSELASEAASRFESRAQDLDIDLGTVAAVDLPPVLADAERIGHVFDNLVGNALEHTTRGGSIRLSAEADTDFVRFAVADNGEGIAPEHLPHLFEKFYRVPGTRHSQGAGLGLAIAREIVVAHGGQIDVASRPGQGTTFTFTLPKAPITEHAESRETTRS
jgi:NtrC-family two-component system sensor histidine kinase KinB